MTVNYDKIMEHIQESGMTSEAIDASLDAMTFVQSLHQMFKDNGMTTKEEPDLAELENLVDALYGELGAAVLFLCEPSFARVPDMLRTISKQLSKYDDDDVVPAVIVKGFERLAKRLENTRVNQQQLARITQRPPAV